jgi:multisubunit Na+/H+ antiporter MnhB subunit
VRRTVAEGLVVGGVGLAVVALAFGISNRRGSKPALVAIWVIGSAVAFGPLALAFLLAGNWQ